MAAILRHLLSVVPAILVYSIAITQVFGQAALLPNAKQTFVDGTGKPLAGGKVYMYVPGSTNKKTTWSDNTQTSNNTNPIILDSAGRAVIFGQGAYDQKVESASGVPQWNSYTEAYGSSEPSGATGTDTAPVGAVVPWASFVEPTNWQFAYGQAVSRTDFPDLLTALTIRETTASCISGSPTLSGLSSTAQMRIGAAVEATCIPTGSTITAIPSSSSITVSNNAATTSTSTLTVFPWGNGDGANTFNVPDLRGVVISGPDAMGGSAADKLQVQKTITTTSGSPTATVNTDTGLVVGMIIQSANVPSGTTLTSWSGTTITMSGNASASASGTAASFLAFQSAGQPAASGGSIGHTQTVAELVSHDHGGVTGNNSANPSVPYTPASADTPGSGTFINALAGASNASTNGTHTHSISAQGGGNAFSVLNPVLNMNFIIKMKSNTSGSGGVVSWGGLIGDISTDSTLQAYVVGTTNYAGIADADDARVLANISGGTAQPLPVSNSQWLDYTIGSTRGMLPYRGPATWGALSLGANNTWLKSDGTDATWAALPVGSSVQQGILQGDGSTLTITAGTIACTTGSVSQLGCLRPDGVTVTSVGGTLTAIGAATTSIGIGVTTVAGGLPGQLLYNDGGVLGGVAFGTPNQFLQTDGSSVAFADAVYSVTCGTGLTGGTFTTTGTCNNDTASTANIWAATSNKMLEAGNVFNAAGALVALTGTSSVTPDFSTGFNFSFTATAGTNYTLENPTNPKVGQQGCIYLVQPSSLTVTTITFGANWYTSGGVSGKALTPTNSAVDRVCYLVRTSSFIDFSLANNLQH